LFLLPAVAALAWVDVGLATVGHPARSQRKQEDATSESAMRV